MQVTETPDKEAQGDKQPEATPQRASSRVPAIAVSLSALAIIGAATANSLPNFNPFALPIFNQFSLPNFDYFALPNFDRFAAQLPHETVSVPIPDPAVSATLKDMQLLQQQNAATLKDIQLSQQQNAAALKDIQLSQQQNAAVLVSLAQGSATQQADSKRISRQLTSLAAQADALQSAMTPLTTSSIPRSSTRARFVRASRKIISPLPKPVGPVSVRGAPLSPAPASGSGSG
jgi:hypothetical protein